MSVQQQLEAQRDEAMRRVPQLIEENTRLRNAARAALDGLRRTDESRIALAAELAEALGEGADQVVFTDAELDAILTALVFLKSQHGDDAPAAADSAKQKLIKRQPLSDTEAILHVEDSSGWRPA